MIPWNVGLSPLGAFLQALSISLFLSFGIPFPRIAKSALLAPCPEVLSTLLSLLLLLLPCLEVYLIL